MKYFWITIALVCAIACGVLGYLLAKRQPYAPGSGLGGTTAFVDKDDDVVESMQKVDPKYIICKEAGRLATGFKELKGIAVGPEDRVYAAGDKAFVVLGSDGQKISRVELDKTPTCLAVGSDSTVYVGLWDHVEVFDSQGARKGSWSNPTPKSWITSIAVTETEVFVADFGEKRVLRYDKTGKLLGRLAPEGKGDGFERYEIPSPYFDVAVDASGSPWVAHTGRRVLENYNSEGKLGTSWGKSGPALDSFWGCCNPSHIAIRKDGSFVTAEKGVVRVKIHAANGDLIGVVAAAKDFQKGIHGLDLAVDSKDRILVADPGTSTVRIYVLKGAESHP
jgi:hypothetical protein